MKVLLLKDVYNLGRAGEVKKVADGYGRNFLLPKNMAVLATPGTLKQIDRIRETASKAREMLNAEKAGLAGQLDNLGLTFTAKAGESGKLFGSITQQMIVDAIKEKLDVEIDRHQVESQPLRETGEHAVRVRLTFDLIPQVNVTVVAEEKQEEQVKETRGKAPRRANKPEEKIEEKLEEKAIEKEEEQPVEEAEKKAVERVEEKPEVKAEKKVKKKAEEKVEAAVAEAKPDVAEAEIAEETAVEEKKTKKAKKSK